MKPRLGQGSGVGCPASAYLADTLVVKETHSLTKVSGVVPVMSSHCAGVVPPGITECESGQSSPADPAPVPKVRHAEQNGKSTCEE